MTATATWGKSRSHTGHIQWELVYDRVPMRIAHIIYLTTKPHYHFAKGKEISVTKAAVIKGLHRMNACSNAVAWAKGFTSDQEAWDACERADWMLWIAGKLCGGRGSKEHRKVVLAACACARTALKFVPKREERPLKAILLAESYGRGKNVSQEDLRAAANAAYIAAANAADAANAAYAAAAVAREKALADMAKLVRKIIPKVPRVA